MTHADHLNNCKLDEFLEFLVRTADLAVLGGDYQPLGDDEGAAGEGTAEVEAAGDAAEAAGGADAGGQSMLLQDKLFHVIDLFLRLCRDPKLKLRAVRPSVAGLGDSESDYED